MHRSSERRFLDKWVSLLWHVMSATGKGYRRHSLKNTGVDDDRRADKLQVKHNSIGVAYTTPFDPPESKAERAARQRRLGVSNPGRFITIFGRLEVRNA